MQVEAEAPVTEPRSLEGIGIALSGVARRFGRRPLVTALEGLDLSVRAGEVVAVVGPSGCGKSTLLEIVAGLQEPDEGTVALVGAEPGAGRRDASAYMPQRDLLLPWRDALGNAGLALECQGVSKAEARRRAEPLFARFGLRRVRALATGRALGRHAPARGLPAHAPGRAPRPAAGRALRRAGLHHPLGHAGMAGRRRWPPSRAPSCW